MKGNDSLFPLFFGFVRQVFRKRGWFFPLGKSILFFFLLIPTSGLLSAAAEQSGGPAGLDAFGRNKKISSVRVLVEKMTESVSRVDDYTCIFTKQEYVDGKLLPEETIFLKQRKIPFSVYMKWVEEPHKGREVLFLEGKYEDKLMAHEGSGVKKLLGTLALNPEGNMAMKDSRHPVTDAGIYHIAEIIQDDFDRAMNHPEHGVRYSDVQEVSVHGRPALRVLALHPPDPGLKYYAPQVEIYIHSSSYLPVSIIVFDEKGTKIEHYTYRDYRINPGLTGRDFHVDNPAYDF